MCIRDRSYDRAADEIRKAIALQELPVYVQVEGDILFAKQDYPALYFERLRIPSAVGTPEEIVGKLRTELNATNAALDQVKKEIADYWAKEKNLCLQVHARYKQLATLFGVRQYAARYNDKFILAGWIPAREEKKFQTALDAIDAIEYSIQYQGDGNKAIFYYIADERVDFRQLIKVLAEAFRVRIEMKQILSLIHI